MFKTHTYISKLQLLIQIYILYWEEIDMYFIGILIEIFFMNKNITDHL